MYIPVLGISIVTRSFMRKIEAKCPEVVTGPKALFRRFSIGPLWITWMAK